VQLQDPPKDGVSRRLRINLDEPEA